MFICLEFEHVSVEKNHKRLNHCTAMQVYRCIRGVDCVIKTCAVNQWLSVQTRPVNDSNNTKGGGGKNQLQ